MAKNKVIFGDQVLLDLSSDTITPNDVLQGKSFHDRAGESQTGALVTHDIVPTPDASLTETNIVDAVKAALLEGGENDDVPSNFGMGTWSNLNAIVLLHDINEGDTGVGVWTDTYETDDDRTGWLWAADLYQVLKKDVNGVMQTVLDVEIYPVHDGGENESLSLFAYRIDDDYPQTIDGVTINGGCVAFKLNAPVQSTSIKIGIKILLQRTMVKDFTVIS